MSVNKTSLNLNNAYVKQNGVVHSPQLIKLGNNIVWPRTKVVEFKTLQSGGELNFTVGATTKYIAVTVDDADIYIFSSNEASKDKVVAASSTYSENYTLSNNCTPIDVSIPLYLKKDAIIAGRGTILNRYAVDYHTGSLSVRVRLGLGVANNFTVGVTGKGSITSNVNAGSDRIFSFNALNQGNKTVTITNNTTGDTFSRIVNINTSNTAINSQVHTMASQAEENASIGSIEKSIKIYSLTEQEANDNLQASYGSEAVIGFDLKPMLNVFAGARQHDYWIVFLKILHGGAGYPANARIGMVDMGYFSESTYRSNISNTYRGNRISFGYAKGSFGWYAGFRHGDLVTNSNGTVTGINRDYYPNHQYYQFGGDMSPDFYGETRDKLLAGTYRLDELRAPDSPMGREYEGATNFGLKQLDNRKDITTNSWRTTGSRYGRAMPSPSIPAEVHSQINYWNDIPYDFYYTAANNGGYPAQAGGYSSALAAMRNSIRGDLAYGYNRKVVFPGANLKNVNLVWTGDHGSAAEAQLDGGKWFDNLLIQDGGAGDIESLSLNDIHINEIIVQSQPQFKVLQSDYIPTTTNRSGSNKVRISASPNFLAMHGGNIDYTYTD